MFKLIPKYSGLKGVRQMDHSQQHKQSLTQPNKSRPVDESTIFTCPMHPEIRQNKPGNCPICGMTLEVLVATNDTDDHELKYMTRRFWFATLFSVPLFVMEMGSHLFGFSPVSPYIQFALATPVCIWSAWPFYVRAIASLRNMHLNM